MSAIPIEANEVPFMTKVALRVTADFGATVNYRARWERIPESGIALRWFGRNLRDVRVLNAPEGLNDLRAHRYAADFFMRPTKLEGIHDLEVEYSIDLDSATRTHVGLGAFSLHNLPWPSHALRFVAPAPQSPWIQRPPIEITVQGIPELSICGPRYDGAVGSMQEDRFGFYGESSLSKLIVGSLTLLVPGKYPVFAPSVQVARISREDAMLVQSHLRFCVERLSRLYGSPLVREPDIIVIQGKEDDPSFCIGSTLIINLTTPPWASTGDRRRAILRNSVAHECAHTWWSFGAHWGDGATGLRFQEALAAFHATWLAGAATGTYSDEDSLSLQAVAQWAAVASRWRGKRKAGLAGVSVARLLWGLVTRSPRSITQSLTNLWALAKTCALTAEHVVESFADIGRVLCRVVDLGRPVIGRLQLTQQGDNCTLTLLTARKDRELLGAQLQVLPTPGAWQPTSRGMEFYFAPDELHDVVACLEQYHLVSTRVTRWIRVERSCLTYRMAGWAEMTLDASPPARLRSRILASLLMILLNPDDPRGYAVAADISIRVPVMSRWLSRLADTRSYRTSDPMEPIRPKLL